MPRFVLLYHECPPSHERLSHWDLMLESGAALRTWALVELPHAWRTDGVVANDSRQTVEAEELAAHRLTYLEYEGPISGERGAVRRVDAGTYETIVDTGDFMDVNLVGEQWRGRATLRRVADKKWALTIDSIERADK